MAAEMYMYVREFGWECESFQTGRQRNGDLPSRDDVIPSYFGELGSFRRLTGGNAAASHSVASSESLWTVSLWLQVEVTDDYMEKAPFFWTAFS